MSMVLYKRWFEVRILHDYYLSGPDLTSIYALDPEDQPGFLNDKVRHDQYDIRQYLDVIPADTTRALMKDYHIRMALLPTGFLVGVRVTTQTNDSGDEEYIPMIPVSQALHLTFHLRARAAHFSSFTNLKIRRTDPAQYYFSNTNDEGLKVYPSLSLPVENFRAGTAYETGELAVVANILKEARQETSSPSASLWRPVAGSGLANERDRFLLPKQYTHTFVGPVNNAEVTLRQADGQVVKKISQGSAALTRMYLDFRQTAPLPGEEPRDIPDGQYRLEINSNGTTETRPVYLSDEYYRRADAALLSIDTGVSDPAFRVLNEDGTLITRRKANGTIEPHPVYEIRFKRRSTYWRYRSDSGLPLATTTKTSSFLSEQDGHLITKELRPLTHFFTAFALDDPDTPPLESIYLPNPRVGPIRLEAKKLVSDIYVSPIKGLIGLK